MGLKVLSYGSKHVFLLTLLRRATRSSSVIGFAVGYFLRLYYTDYCCGWLNPLETTFTFWRSRFTCFDSRSRSWSIEHRLRVRKTWRSFLSRLPQMSHLSQSVKRKMTFWRLDPVWSPGFLNPRVESNDVKLIFIFVFFNKYYCVLSLKFRHSFNRNSNTSVLHVKQLWQLQAKYLKTSNFKIHILSFLCIPNNILFKCVQARTF